MAQTDIGVPEGRVCELALSPMRHSQPPPSSSRARCPDELERSDGNLQSVQFHAEEARRIALFARPPP